jgi:hypothetical protein
VSDLGLNLGQDVARVRVRVLGHVLSPRRAG